MSEEWSEWFLHDGRGCPCVGQMVQFYLRGNKTGKIWLSGRIVIAGSEGGESWDWRNKHVSHIIRYRIRKPKGLTILEGLLENLPKEVEAVG